MVWSVLQAEGLGAAAGTARFSTWAVTLHAEHVTSAYQLASVQQALLGGFLGLPRLPPWRCPTAMSGMLRSAQTTCGDLGRSWTTPGAVS